MCSGVSYCRAHYDTTLAYNIITSIYRGINRICAYNTAVIGNNDEL